MYWDATLSGGGFTAEPITIRDFCAGGLFLTAQSGVSDRKRFSADHLHAGERVAVRFTHPVDGTEREVTGSIVRESSAGLGLAFSAPQRELVTAFHAIATDQSPASEPQASSERTISRLAREALQLYREQAQGFFSTALPEFVNHAGDQLFERASNASSNDEQHAYYSGFRYLRDARADLPQQFADELMRRMTELTDARFTRASKRMPEVVDELALVDEREFEDWLNRSDAINRAETRFAIPLVALNRRLSYIVGHRLDELSNPLAPAVVCEILSTVLDLSKFERKPARTLHEAFSQTVTMRLGTLYEGLNARFHERGILPGIENERPEIRVSSPPQAGEQAATQPELDPDSQACTEAASDSETMPAPQGQPQQGSAAPIIGSSPSPPPSASPSRTLPAARELLAARNRLLHRGPSRFATAGVSTIPAPGAPTFAASEVLGAVDHLHANSEEAPNVTTDVSLMERVMGRLHADGAGAAEKQLAPETHGTVELLDNWFGSLRDDPLNTRFLRDWSGRLAILALRAQLEKGGFLQENPQPIHHLLNQLDRSGVALAVLRGAEQDRLQRKLEQLLQRALSESREQPEVVREIADEIATLVERPLSTRAVNMQKVLQQCEGTQKLERAKRLVNQEIDKRVAEHMIPKLLLGFIDQGWRNLLVLVNLRSGVDSDQWRRGLAVLDRLIAGLGIAAVRARPIAEPEKVASYIERQLTAFGRYTPELQSIVGEIRDYLLAVRAQGRAPRPLPMVKARRSNANELALTAKIKPYWLGQAKLLGVGDWVFFAGKDGTPEPLRLQWISEERTRFVFVNRSGIKAKDITLAELAQLLEVASAGLTEDMDMPLTERQWQKKLQDLHDELVRFATHDPLTGCLNRKALQKALEQLPSGREAHNQWHALLYFALDGFKVINSTLGHEGGDELLQQVADQLRESIAGRGCVARMGGDEFAVLAEHCSANEARVLAEQQRLALYERRFVRDDESLTVSASVGVVPFTLESRSPKGLLKDADEACLAAKNAGGNHLHMLTPDDRELKQLRSSMAQAAQVDKALETGKLRLRCQRIQPIADDPALRPFYEILISILGPTDHLIPPKDFIPAAERFGRMTAVDRWVIREVLDWCAHNGDALTTLDGFTVNLCGPTLNDGDLANYLRSQLDRTGVSGELLCFEVTETAAVQNLARAADLIREVKELGCRFSLDDFGSGLSSYSYLKNLPVDYLKVDGQFVRDIDRDEADHAMVRSINELGHFLGKRTIAEFVENDKVLYQLKDIGLDFAQGYGVGRPMPIEELIGQI
ncbi:hypothetical protein NB231_02578 [Nitrococcus mobilis Nb-231]|uniref:Uncharacterized protein n=1 Tax=Nitrococcus mobilis Nb-231 TaxID=314278 RepID=A4BRP5_9GAMM|nr:hypothetical protein NB231_02578 [Nitrococcus mobilis Nb-231]